MVLRQVPPHIHLQSRNTLGGAGDFKIHIASKIFGVHKVSQNIRFVAIHHQAHSNASDWTLERHAGIHKSETRATSGSHRGRAVLRHDLSDATNSIWEIFLAWENWHKGTFCKISVTNLATARATNAANFANRIAWRIVVVHVTARAVGDFHSINELRIAERRQSDNIHSLGYATRKEAGTVSAWQNADLRTKRTNLVKLAAIWANTVFDNMLAHIFLTASSNASE